MKVYHPAVLKARLPLSLAFGLGLLFLLLFSSSNWEGHPLVETPLFSVACFLVGLASLGRLWCSLYIAGYKMERLVTEGPYSICRNPLYFFSFLGMVGCALATETVVIPLVVLLAFGLYYPQVIKNEEIELRRLHGSSFDSYLRSTPAFFPKLRLLAEPQYYRVNPRIFRKHMFDALWFVWIVGLLELIEGIHETDALPILLHLY